MNDTRVWTWVGWILALLALVVWLVGVLLKDVAFGQEHKRMTSPDIATRTDTGWVQLRHAHCLVLDCEICGPENDVDFCHICNPYKPHIAPLLKLYREYEDSCWADSSRYGWGLWYSCFEESCSVGAMRLYGSKSTAHLHQRMSDWQHQPPYFEGFIEFLRRRYK